MKPAVLWFTGLSGAGKTTIAKKVQETLKARNIRCEHLDGDEIRRYFSSLGFSKPERNEHVRRVGYMAKVLERNGIVVLASLVSPYREARDDVRKMVENFVEIYVSTPLEVCEGRDVKGLYRAARSGKMERFTGVSDPYEPPVNPELTLDTSVLGVEESLQKILDYLEQPLT